MNFRLLHLRKYANSYGFNFLRQSQGYPHTFSLRGEFSSASGSSKHQASGSEKKPLFSAETVGSKGSPPPGGSLGPGNQLMKLFLGSAAVVAAITTAFYAEWPGKIPTGGNEREDLPLLDNEAKQKDGKTYEVIHGGIVKDEDSAHSKEEFSSSSLSQEKEKATEEGTKQNDQSREAYPGQHEFKGLQQEGTTQDAGVQKEGEVNDTVENASHFMNDYKQEVKDTNPLNAVKGGTASNGIIFQHTTSSEEVHQVKVSENTDSKEVDEHKDGKQEVAEGGSLIVGKDSEMLTKVTTKDVEQDEPQDQISRSTLSDAYFLSKEEQINSQGFSDENLHDSVSISKQKEDANGGMGNIKEPDGVLVLNFLEAIHAAEERQAQLDANIYAEYKQKLKEKYEKELKDARARELMYAEEADSLEKELSREKEKAATALKSLKEKAEERLKSELQRKEEEADLKLEKAQLLTKAEAGAAIANEKSSHLNEMADAKLQIDALCTAFYTRSEEARQSHSVHKLALGTFALEDAIMKGAPLHKELAVLRAAMDGIDKDALLCVALSSFPPETITHGTKTPAQLYQKFKSLKGSLRELALIPASGGGVLTHALARIASSMKVKEDDLHCEGIESIIAHVEQCLGEGKLIEAASVLESGTQGSKAESIASEWARQVRHRAVTEQTLSLLQAHATAIAFSLT